MTVRPSDLAELPPATCLIVDDLEENLIALSALLRRDGVTLVTARSGAEALEHLLVHDVALALVDVQMPDMDGFELAELMRGTERTRQVPIIFVTAGARDEHRLFRGYESGAVDFLYKPIEPHLVRSKADVFFQLYRQKRRLAQELKERTETLRLSEMFSAMLGHDLRNPLATIIGSAQLLPRMTRDPEILRVAERMETSGMRMNRMIGDMLDLARARLAGGIPVHAEPADLRVVVDKVVQEYAATWPQRRIDLRASGDLAGEWDADRIAQIAGNLVGNALQHGDAEAPVEVFLDGRERPTVELTVANAGTIPDDVLPYVFDPFRRARQHGRSDGLGLGLYIARQLAQSHRGTIEVDAAGNRIALRVRLPRRAGEA